MKFEIAFNKHDIGTDKDLEKIGAVLEEFEIGRGEVESYYTIELETFEDLEKLENRIHDTLGYFAIIIGFDHPTIFIDNL
jgi:hypothetical protein